MSWQKPDFGQKPAAEEKSDFGQWDVILKDGVQHVVPRNDLICHLYATECWCKPIIEAKIVVHHSLDGREERDDG